MQRVCTVDYMWTPMHNNPTQYGTIVKRNPEAWNTGQANLIPTSTSGDIEAYRPLIPSEPMLGLNIVLDEAMATTLQKVR